MIDAGLGESHASSFVSNMGIPTPNQRIIKSYEKKVGKTIEAVSDDESCKKALSLEKARSKTDADHTAKINVQYDMRLGKRRRAINIARQVLGLLPEKKREKLLHLGPEIQAVELAISQKDNEKKQSSMIAVKTGLNLRRQWSLM